MQYYKFELIRGGKNPLIRITYRVKWFLMKEKLITRDVVKYESIEGFWVFCDNDNLTHDFQPINAFYKSGDKEYIVNGSIKRASVDVFTEEWSHPDNDHWDEIKD